MSNTPNQTSNFLQVTPNSNQAVDKNYLEQLRAAKAAQEAAANAQIDALAPCPSCGYCPHCGRSNAVRPWPYYAPYYRYVNDPSFDTKSSGPRRMGDLPAVWGNNEPGTY